MKPTAYKRRVARALLRYIPCPFVRRVALRKNLNGWGRSKAADRLLEGSANAFFFGMLFDYQILASEAYERPLQLRSKLGHLDVQKIARMSERSLEAKIRGSERGESLHRFPKRMAKTLISACRKLLREYDGNAANIWADGDASKLIERLDAFYGVGTKLARMMTRLLGTYYGVKLRRLNKVDVAVDRHVARVFLRTGLVPAPKGESEVRVATVRQAVTEAARALKPAYPAALDEPAFVIGRKWCRQEQAYCDYPGEPCALHKVCRKDRTHLRVV